MRAQHLFRLDTAILVVMSRMGTASIPEVLSEIERVQVEADTASLYRAVTRLKQEGLITCNGHELKHGRYLVRVYSATIRGKQEASQRVDRLAGLIGIDAPYMNV